MMELLIDGMAQVQSKMSEAGKESMRLLEAGHSVEWLIQPYKEETAQARRTGAQNKLYFLLYQRIGKTLHGNDELHARRECKLKIGCRILRRDSEDFAATYDAVIRPLDYETKLKSMDLISVSSIMSVKQGTEYIKRILQIYSENGVYFADIDGTAEYSQYRESQQ